jgi:hypothetical protein
MKEIEQYFEGFRPFAWKLKWMIANAFDVSYSTASYIWFVTICMMLIGPYLAFLVYAAGRIEE